MRPHTPFSIALIAAGMSLGSAQALDETQFHKLHQQLQPASDEAWRTLPWKLSILEARAAAEKSRKPVYMLVRSGHPLGCV